MDFFFNSTIASQFIRNSLKYKITQIYHLRFIIFKISYKLHNYNIVIPKSIIIYISITSNISNNQTFRQILL